MLDPNRRFTRTAAAIGLLLALSRPAAAGPPLICHPFEAGNAPVLPWGQGPGWNEPDRSYDLGRLTTDTLRLLSADVPVLARMENLRRATIYASEDPRVGAELMTAVLGRALARAAEDPRDPLPWFDAGYLIESYRQKRAIERHGISSRWEGSSPTAAVADGLDGYRLVRKALELAGSSPEMEYAASLMKNGPASAEHRRRALEAAKPGSLLAKALAH